ncbi:MAG: AraC family transcriptional regulator [Vallitaleaceae bacterium]|jgi:AraC family cel operon transcriptional repressor|nr:AraC family transcriptional regulator [Vallitaleaceae bacterium]
MTLKQLDQQLRSLSTFEREIQNLDQRDMKLRFSRFEDVSHWVINSDKLMPRNEEIAIHKHDRFIDFTEHTHDYLEMMFVYSGEIGHNIKGKTLILKKGEILLMDMATSHSIKMAGEEDIAINVIMKREFFDSFFLNQIGYNDKLTGFVVNAISNRSICPYLHFQSSENEKIWALIIDVLLEYYDQKNGMETAIRAYMLLLFNELIRNYHHYLDDRLIRQVDASVAVDIASYIDEHYKALTLKEMAKVFNYNSDYLGKQIKKLTGESLKNLVKKRKLKEAANLLRNTELSILEILEIISYSNASYFYKQFKLEYTMTPDEYRNKQ